MDNETLPEDMLPAPRHGAELQPPADIVALVRAVAAQVDCAADFDVCALAKVKPSTLESWRKRGEGPPYVLFGNRPLYPFEGLRQFLRDKQRSRPDTRRSLL